MKKWLGLVFILMLVLMKTWPYLQKNIGFVLANTAIGLPLKDEDRLVRLQQALQQCAAGNEVVPVDANLTRLLAEQFDSCYLNHLSPLYVITETTHMPITSLYLGGVSQSNRITDETASLFGAGYLEAIIFPAITTSNVSVLSITALHDDPPPVTLTIWLDEAIIGEFNFERGDKTWETLSLPLPMGVNFHRLRIEYSNDLYDVALGLDRNAYIKDVTISQ
ncbi:MAG: hypothetical protein IAE79_03240 [Anaerolinea sp.]|nr:hypothetical protein [Anaerolinea sp.]